MGVTYVDVKVSSISNGKAVYALKCLVDTGATDLLLPAKMLKQIGVKPVGKRRYELADGKIKNFQYGLVKIELNGELKAADAIFGPDKSEPRLGVTILESMGLVVDPRNRKLKKLPSIPLK